MLEEHTKQVEKFWEIFSILFPYSCYKLLHTKKYNPFLCLSCEFGLFLVWLIRIFWLFSILVLGDEKDEKDMFKFNSGE